MGTHVLKVPDIGEGIAEVELVAWHVQPGDAIVADQVVAELMTDKATVEVPSAVAGRVVALGGKLGDKLAVAEMLDLCPRSIDNLMAQGMPHLRIGKRRVRFDLPEVRAWAKRHYGVSRMGKECAQ